MSSDGKIPSILSEFVYVLLYHVYKIILHLRMEVTVFWNVMFTNVSEEPSEFMFRLGCSFRQQVPPKHSYVTTRFHGVTY
jgi:hypothetical protein